MNVLTIPLSTVPCFSELHLSDITFLESIASHKRIETGEVLFSKQGNADSCFLVLEGTVMLQMPQEDNDPIPLMTLNSGELIGWSWLFHPRQWNFDALATGPCELMVFDAESILRRMDWDNGFGFRMMQALTLVMHDRLLATRMQLLNASED